MTITELRNKRAKTWEAAKAFLDSHRNADGFLSAEDDATYTNMENEITALGNEISRLERLEAIAARVSVPLVLHGTSGVPVETVRACILRGISKVNYATDLRITFTKATVDYFAENPKAYDPKKYLGCAKEAVAKRVCELIQVCGSEGKA